MSDFAKSTVLLFVLLNPFLVIIYLVDLVETLESQRFLRVLVQGGLIAAVVFCCFGLLGDAVFTSVVQAEFASFQIFGGLVFLLIGMQFVFRGPNAIEMLRGHSPNLAGAIAMPVLIGPGTISASVVIGQRHTPLLACTIIFTAVAASIILMLALKKIHDIVRPRSEPLIKRYIEITGRIMALYVGTVAVEMIMKGIRTWIEKF
ncbi:MAG: MarC family protein [Steroidobacteraceae bacterium]